MAQASTKQSRGGRKLTVLVMGPKESQELRNLLGGNLKGNGAARTHFKAIQKALSTVGYAYQNKPNLKGYVFVSNKVAGAACQA